MEHLLTVGCHKSDQQLRTLLNASQENTNGVINNIQSDFEGTIKRQIMNLDSRTQDT
jgi:hypothetical protein